MIEIKEGELVYVPSQSLRHFNKARAKKGKVHILNPENSENPLALVMVKVDRGFDRFPRWSIFPRNFVDRLALQYDLRTEVVLRALWQNETKELGLSPDEAIQEYLEPGTVVEKKKEEIWVFR